MKFLELAVFMLCLQVSIGILNGAGILEVNKNYQGDWLDTINNAKSDTETSSYQESPVATEYQFDLGATLKGIFFFGKSIVLCIIAVPYTLSLFGLREPFIYLVSVPVYLIYLIALAQFISNRSAKGMH